MARTLWAAMILGAMQSASGTGCTPAESRSVSSTPVSSTPVSGSSVSATPKARICRFGEPSERIAVENAAPREEHALYDLPDDPGLWEPAPPDDAVARYRASVSARLNGAIDPRTLLQHERAVMAKVPDGAGEAENNAKVLDGRAGAIVPVSCIEAMIWTWQASRFPMLEHPTEIGAFVLRGHGRVHVYGSSLDRMGQKIRHEVVERVAADKARGFAVVAHVHNHPFMFDRCVGDSMWTTEATKDDPGGGVAPSITDVNFYRNMRAEVGLEGAWITNGFDSGHYRSADFDVLVARP